MPHKHNADRRKMAFKIENWPEYEAGSRRRGSLTLWIEDGALDHWQTLGPGGPGSLWGCGHPDHADGSHGVQVGVAADGRSAGISHYTNGS
jgi:hypothetical protein